MLKNKVVVITGGSKGIGYAIAEIFAKNGAKIVIADIDRKNGMQAAKNVGGEFVPCDISKEHEVARLFEEATKHYSVVNIIVNTAKIYMYKNLKSITVDQWNSSVMVNINGLFLLAKHGMPLLEEVGGVFIEVASGLGVALEKESAPYSTTEAAAFALIKNIAKTYAGKARAVGINPGPINTPLLHVAFSGDVQKYGKLNPSKRVGEANEVAALALYLASDNANYVTGTIINIDGGEGN